MPTQEPLTKIFVASAMFDGATSAEIEKSLPYLVVLPYPHFFVSTE